MPTAYISDRNYYIRLREIKSLTELADYTAASVDGTRVGAKTCIPEFVTFQRFPENRRNRLEQVEPTETARMLFKDYKRLRDTYQASGNRNPKVDSLVSMAESYL